MGSTIHLRIRDSELRRAVAMSLGSVGMPASLGPDRIPDIIVTTVHDISVAACRWLTTHCINVIVLAAVPTPAEKDAYLDAGGVYLPMLLRGGATLRKALAELPEMRSPVAH